MRRALKVLPAAAVLCGALLLAGCQDELYSGMSEKEANEMLAALMSNGIDANKAAKGKEGYTVTVDGRDMLRSIAILNDKGLPKRTRESVGKVFEKSGIMSSPFEERVRYIYALGEDVAQTLSQIDGVVTARVHLVIPDAPQLGQAVKPSSAAVFIKHQPGTDIEFLVPQIRRLVSSAIEGLDYQSVTVVLTEAQASKQTSGAALNSTTEVLPGLAVRETDLGRFWQVVAVAVAATLAIVALVVGVTVLVLRSRRGGGKSRREVAPDPLVEPS